jgi:siroheme synthase-like protein
VGAGGAGVAGLPSGRIRGGANGRRRFRPTVAEGAPGPDTAAPEPQAPHYYYPVFLDVAGRRCVVVGGDQVAASKAIGLLRCGARVTVLAEEAHPSIVRLARRGRLRWLNRPFADGDVEGAALVVVTTAAAGVAARVARQARVRRALCQVVDDPERSDFISPAVCQRGSLMAAISTCGGSPALAARLKRELEAAWGPEYGQVTSLMRRLRGVVRERLPDPEGRRRFWLAAAAEAGELLELCRAGRREEARRRLLQALERAW